MSLDDLMATLARRRAWTLADDGTLRARAGEYDGQFEESVAGLVYCDGDQKTLHPLKGVRE